MTRWVQGVFVLTLAGVSLLALLFWWWLRHRPEERVILKTQLGTISRVRGPRTPRPSVRHVEGPSPSHEDVVPGDIKSTIPSLANEAPLDDLKRIAGIGPKISDVLQAAGIASYDQLASTEIGRLRQVLNQAGIRLAAPDTWPDQARLAAASDWDGLKALQSQLKAGRRV